MRLRRNGNKRNKRVEKLKGKTVLKNFEKSTNKHLKSNKQTQDNEKQPLTPTPLRRINPVENLLVWAKCRGFGWLPGRIASRKELSGPIDPPDDPTRWVNWFEDHKYTETHVEHIAPFHEFTTFFRESMYQRRPAYKTAVDDAIIEAACRADKNLGNSEDGIKWAKENFWPEGYTMLLPENITAKDIHFKACDVSPPTLNLNERIKGNPKTAKCKENALDLESQLLKRRNGMIEKVSAGLIDIEQLCLGCGSLDIKARHPIFSGGLCADCQIDFKEHSYVCDDEGYYSYCAICVGGEKIMLCDNENCGRTFCTICLEIFLGKGLFKKESSSSAWKCLLCRPTETTGVLTRRDNWQTFIYDMICEDENTSEYTRLVPVPLPFDCSVRRPVKVLSLFDGIGTGFLALKEIGVKVDNYYASEIDVDAISVVNVRHPAVTHIGDVKSLTNEKLLAMGPFDLLLGGSPCNDLSIVNPARKGLWSEKGTGNLFFEYVRVLNACQLMSSVNNRPFFWLFENVVCMDIHSRETINHFLQLPKLYESYIQSVLQHTAHVYTSKHLLERDLDSHTLASTQFKRRKTSPVILDAVKVSPAKRPRMFWGNLPGMKRPMVARSSDRLSLQECLEQGRYTNLTKINTVTTNANTIKCKASAILQMDSNGGFTDNLWSVEIERLFGLPDHYTDVNNLSRSARQKVLGKSWSIAVIKHLLTPLRDFYALV